MAKTIPGIKVNQWMDFWDDYNYDPHQRRRKPKSYFYLFKMSAPMLKSLSGIFRRTTTEKTKGFIENIQRGHEVERSERIKRFIRFGYPYSDLSKQKQDTLKYENLKKPGWLPTAIIVNILTAEDQRKGKYKVDENDLIIINEKEGDFVEINPPRSFSNDTIWKPKVLHPIEVIDGQHRLWAFENDKEAEKFELPVVAFRGLDISWQAYLFWSINITPKKINASLAYDLYPLLRSEDWLDLEDNYIIYRETRSQELVEGLWSNPESPWYRRINMLGEKGLDTVSQSAFLRSLIATFLRSKQKGLGGLFSAELPGVDYSLPWNGANQVAFLIFIWKSIVEAINNTESSWAKALRKLQGTGKGIQDPAFSGKNNLLKTDQGVRGVLYIFNDISYSLSRELNLEEVFSEGDKSGRATDESEVKQSLIEIRKDRRVSLLISEVAKRLADFDWRSSAAPNLTPREESIKAGYRGSGGYKMLRYHLLELLSRGTDEISKVSKKIRNSL